MYTLTSFMRAEGEFLDVIEKKILRLLLLAIHSHLNQQSLLPPMVFLYLRFQQQQLTVGGGFGIVYIISWKAA